MISPPAARGRRTALGAVVVGGLAALALAGAPTARAQAVSNTFSANIDASGVHIHVSGQGLPAANVIEVAPWAALARLDNTQSLGQAGVPYLGDFITPLIGTVNGLGGGGANLPPLPTLPGYVSSAFPNNPSGSQENAGYLISSESSEREVTSRVQVGLPPVGVEGNSTIFATARAEFDAEAGVLTALGESGLEGLNFGGVVRIGNVSSSVRVVDDGEAEPQVDFSTDIGLVTVLGIPIGIDEDGVSVLGTSIPLLQPADQVVNDALESLGLSLRMLPAQTLVDEETGRVEAVATGALQIGFAAEFPTVGLTRVQLTIGRVYLQFLNRSFPERAAVPPRTGTAAPDAPAPISDSPAPSSSGGLTAPAPSPSGSGVSSSGGTDEIPGSAGPVLAASGLPDSTSFRGLYLVLVLAGLAMVGPAVLLDRAGLVARRIWR